ncbi:glycosyltransferase family 2 protein [Novosphingobium sp. JCM 18896]|uniref:glycosyltransferase family 2 protein n=1 Tax=Novosphingobium sp. JCM 18896 TaxID=2989731 RepID=UPI002223BB19|nr:glycosyltransferase family 2 protein [Novosphingobium sp. JCM 18896]MCW1431466.1 glycosyltransferase family 2 protein [Novosphingobium sp. JCM 18896]
MTIAATLIARNEARCIVRCLDSVRPFVDRLFVLDTGSTDGTQQLARQAGAEVQHFDWPDDFSIARNRALELADADWHLVIDADEHIERGGELLRPWCAAGPRLGRVLINHAFDDSAAGAVTVARSWSTRVIPRGARFEGRVHEQVASPLPRERLEIHLGHDGFRDAQLETKRDRNRNLLLRDIAERPDDEYVAYQLGVEAEGRGEYVQACEWYERALTDTRLEASWFHDLLIRLLHSLGQAGRVDDGLSLAQAHMEAMNESPDFYFVVGNLALDRALLDPADALDHWLPLAVTCWERCLEIGERPELEGSVAGRGSHLATYNLDLVKGQIALLGR